MTTPPYDFLITEWVTDTHWHPRSGQQTDLIVPPGFTRLGRSPVRDIDFEDWFCECGRGWTSHYSSSIHGCSGYTWIESDRALARYRKATESWFKRALRRLGLVKG